MEKIYFDTSDIIASAEKTLKEANSTLSDATRSSRFNNAVAEEINSVISRGLSMARFWKASNPQSHQFEFIDKFPYDNLSKGLLEELQKKGIHIFRNTLGHTTIKVTYTW